MQKSNTNFPDNPALPLSGMHTGRIKRHVFPKNGRKTFIPTSCLFSDSIQ